MINLQENLMNIKKKISESAEKAGVDPNDINIIAVSKTKSPELIQKAVDCGVTLLGENKVQEAESKIDKVKGDVKWHMIGHLQRNKAKLAVELFSMIQSVDSLRLAKEINKRAEEINKVMDVLIQINIGNEPSKYGFDYDETVEAVEQISKLPFVKIKGLMTIAPFEENPEDVRIYFKKMNEMFKKIKQMEIENVDMDFLSMGMTHDYCVAIEEGSNMVRIGTGIFGEREYK